MRLASIADGTRDGALHLVSPAGTHGHPASSVAPCLQIALDRWTETEPQLRALADRCTSANDWPVVLDPAQMLAPLPRAYEWLDGSCYLQHVRLVRQARGAPLPPYFLEEPLVYQGGSGVLLSPRQAVALPDERWGLDFEAEIALIVTDTPRGTRAAAAASHSALLVLANDWTYRELVTHELPKGFGFVNSKPATSFAPFAVTPDELGAAWREGRAHVGVSSTLNGTRVGMPNAGTDMHFSLWDLVEHITKTRSLTAGTIIGGGTVSNVEETSGSSCLVERRAIEMLKLGASITRYLRAGDLVQIEAWAGERNVFGTICQGIVQA